MRVIDSQLIRLVINSNRSKNWHVCSTSVPALGVPRGLGTTFSQACTETLGSILWSLLYHGGGCDSSIPHLVSKKHKWPAHCAMDSSPASLLPPRVLFVHKSIPEHLHCAAAFITLCKDLPGGCLYTAAEGIRYVHLICSLLEWTAEEFWRIKESNLLI